MPQQVHEAIRGVEEHLEKEGKKFTLKKAGTLMPVSYSLDLDIKSELLPIDVVYYQLLVDILRWVVELSRVDICLEVSLMSYHLALPRERYLNKIFHIFDYLK